MKIKAGSILDTSACFGAITVEPHAAFIKQAEEIERSAAIERHAFFDHAMTDPSALLLWASQEAVVTNPFSQALFATLSNIDNVHVRAVLMPVVSGEHHEFSNVENAAIESHPWLIWKLCTSLELAPGSIVVTDAVAKFIEVLFSATREPMKSLGLLGVGNELLLLAEYDAIFKAFEKHFPEAHYADFLKANISEDRGHTMLIERAATALYHLGHPADDYMAGAKTGVMARVSYYDALLEESVRQTEARKGLSE